MSDEATLDPVQRILNLHNNYQAQLSFYAELMRRLLEIISATRSELSTTKKELEVTKKELEVAKREGEETKRELKNLMGHLDKLDELHEES